MNEENNNGKKYQDTSNAPTNSVENTLQENHETDGEKDKSDEFIKRRRLTGMIRLVAGFYFISAVFSGIIMPLRNGTLNMPVYAIVIIGVFGVFGVVIMIDGIRKLMKCS
jgi:hypothetical protein